MKRKAQQASPTPDAKNTASAQTVAPLFGFLRPEPSFARNRASVATLALVNAMMMAGGAQAQTAAAKPTPPAAATDGTTLPEVVVTADPNAAGSYQPGVVSSPKYTAPLRDIPQTVTVIPAAVIEQQGATTLRDVLRNVPGISMQAGEGGTPAGDQFTIRGFSARTDIFIDGIRDIGGYTRDPFNFEQVEVSKGPASAYSGRGSTGGAVNLVTKTPKAEAFYAGSSGVGTSNFTRFTLDLNQPIHGAKVDDLGMAFRVNALWTESDTAGRDEIYNKRWGIAPSLVIGLDKPTTLTLTYFHLDQDDLPDYGIPWVPATNLVLSNYANKPAPVSFSTYYGLVNRDFEHVTTDVGTIAIEHRFDDSVTLRNQFRYGQTNRDSVIATPRFKTPTTTDIFRELKSRDQVDTIIADQLDFKLNFETFGFTHAMDVGAEYDHETSEDHPRSGPDAPLADYLHPDADAPYPAHSIKRTGARNRAEADSLGIYAFDTVKFTEKWELTGGLRWDYFDVDYSSRAANTPLGLPGLTTSYSRTDKFLSWRIGPVYKPLPNGSIYAAYGTAFNPSAEALTLSLANSDLEPEETRTFEAGTKWDVLNERLSVSAAYFNTEKTNARTPSLIPGDPSTVLDGEQRVQGFELGLAGNITEHWKVFGAYTYMDSEITKSNARDAVTLKLTEQGKHVANAPEQTFSLWTTYDLPWGITVGGGMQYIDARFADNVNLKEAPSYVLFDAMVSYKITKNLDARVNIYNLADEEYIANLSGGHFIPGAGRSATFTLNFKF